MDEADQQSVTPSQPVEDAVDQEDCLLSQPTIEVVLDQADQQSVTPAAVRHLGFVGRVLGPPT